MPTFVGSGHFIGIWTTNPQIGLNVAHLQHHAEG
jgi:hypothetical protein